MFAHFFLLICLVFGGVNGSRDEDSIVCAGKLAKRDKNQETDEAVGAFAAQVEEVLIAEESSSTGVNIDLIFSDGQKKHKVLHSFALHWRSFSPLVEVAHKKQNKKK